MSESVSETVKLR